MKPVEKIDVDLDLDPVEEEYEDWQFAYTFEKAKNFVDDTLIDIENFDLCNDDDDYIPGVAIFGLFCELVARLGQMGYKQEDLEKEIRNHLYGNISDTIH